MEEEQEIPKLEENSDSEEEQSEGFFDHLDELRKRIIYSLIAIILGCVFAGVFYEQLIEYVLIKPAQDAEMILQNLQPFGQVYLMFRIVIYTGITIALPLVLNQIWKFVEPGLYQNEKTWAKGIVFFTFFCFICGISFAYFVMLPSMLNFSVNFNPFDIENQIDINYYWSLFTMVILSAGLFFELPVVSFILSRAGLLTPGFMRKYRKHAIVIILILAAIITPSPDPLNQMIVAVPIYTLYEISIIVSKIAVRKYLETRED